MSGRLVLGAGMAALAALGVLCSCGLVFDVDALGRGAGDVADAGSPSTLDGDPEAAAICPSFHGAPMIDAGGQCIDPTEVTVSDYEPFIEAARPLLPFEDPCTWVTTLEPGDFAKQKAHPDFPVVNVNFCHALHYCKWAGKRLCGSLGVGRGAVAPGDAGANPRTNQWLRACTHEGTQSYSYGAVVRESACPNIIGPVKMRGACAGAYPDLFDMLGNAGEWIDGCVTDGLPPEHHACTALGYERVRGEASCYDLTELSRNQISPDLGFRCCGL